MDKAPNFYTVKDLINPIEIKDFSKFFEKLEDEDAFDIYVKMTDEGKSMFKKAMITFHQHGHGETVIIVFFHHHFPFTRSKISRFNIGEFYPEELKDFKLIFDHDLCCLKCFEDTEDCECNHDTSDIFDFVTNKEICAICHEELYTDNLLKTKCKHEFHTSCILKHLKVKEKNECPVCRQQLLNHSDLGLE